MDALDRIALSASFISAGTSSGGFRRYDGVPGSNVVLFLPWNTTYWLARLLGLTGIEFLACYETPGALVSADPSRCTDAMREVLFDSEQLLKKAHVRDPLVIGMSLGSYPATVLANRIGARLISVCSADRGDRMIWESPATKAVKQVAISKGYGLPHYARAMEGLHPVQNLSGIAAGSTFVFARHDALVPRRRTVALASAVRQQAPKARIVHMNLGHVATIITSSALQRQTASR